MAKVIGISKYDFKDSNGKNVVGASLYYTEPIEENGIGERPYKATMTMAQYEQYTFMPGDNVKIYFKQNSSRVEDIVLL